MAKVGEELKNLTGVSISRCEIAGESSEMALVVRMTASDFPDRSITRPTAVLPKMGDPPAPGAVAQKAADSAEPVAFSLKNLEPGEFFGLFAKMGDPAPAEAVAQKASDSAERVTISLKKPEPGESFGLFAKMDDPPAPWAVAQKAPDSAERVAISLKNPEPGE
jgi:hypothetical protein